VRAPQSDGTGSPVAGVHPDGEYEVIAVRYGTRTGSRSEIFLNHQIYGEPDTPLDMDYYFWLVRNARRTVLVDTGFGRVGGARRARTTLIEPVAALARLGVSPTSVSEVIVTHAHYDHIGNLDCFPSAEVVMTRREFEFWTGPFGTRKQFAWSVEQDETEYLDELLRDGRLTLVEAARTLAPGIELVPVGGHTPGQAIVLVSTPGGVAVLASDAAHYYEELERDRPFAFVADLEAMYRGFDTLNEIASQPGRVIVPGHDPLVMERFAPVDAVGPGLAVRVG
jgi:glyoxylase-like metal-dependent hydrolase (beta-lactamase superfamily II)